VSKSRNKRARSLSSLRRRQGDRQPRQCILIVCEGAETEPNYFRSLRTEWRLKPVEVEIAGGERGSAPIRVVDCAIRRKRQRESDVRQGVGRKLPFDEVWCVFDKENPPDNPSFFPAVNKASDNGLELAVSTPAFEYWCLLHFVETDRPFRNADEVARALREYLPDYGKGQDVFGRLASHVSVATERAQRLWSNRPDPGEMFPNPSTLVFRLVRKLQDMSHQWE